MVRRVCPRRTICVRETAAVGAALRWICSRQSKTGPRRLLSLGEQAPTGRLIRCLQWTTEIGLWCRAAEVEQVIVAACDRPSGLMCRCGRPRAAFQVPNTSPTTLAGGQSPASSRSSACAPRRRA